MEKCINPIVSVAWLRLRLCAVTLPTLETLPTIINLARSCRKQGERPTELNIATDLLDTMH